MSNDLQLNKTHGKVLSKFRIITSDEDHEVNPDMLILAFQAYNHLNPLSTTFYNPKVLATGLISILNTLNKLDDTSNIYIVEKVGDKLIRLPIQNFIKEAKKEIA